MSQGAQSSQTSTGSLFVYKYQNKRVLAPRQTSYEAAVLTCRAHFPGIPEAATVLFQTKDLAICEGEMTEISKSSWQDVIGVLTSVTVIVNEMPVPSYSAGLMGRPLSPPEDPSQKRKLQIAFLWNDKRLRVRIADTTRMRKILGLIALHTGLCQDDWRWYFGEFRVSPEATAASLGLQENDEIWACPVQKGGKPIIYLFSPMPLEASVKLSLAPQWDLSAIYPVVPIKPKSARSNEEVSWKVRVHPSGDLTELTTGLDVAYLFWEAETDPQIPPSPPPSPILTGEPGAATIEPFCPNAAVLADHNSVVVPVEEVTPYLDKALSVLGLHTEARTSFITYWLPSMLKHKNVAFRFIPQASYEFAAPLEVQPSPDVVTRIFMIFQGVGDEALSEWPAGTAKAGEDATWWKDVVGVDAERAADTSLFRVLEWGGMEVLNSRS